MTGRSASGWTRPCCIANAAACALRRLREGRHDCLLAVVGALSAQRLLGADTYGHRDVLVRGYVHEVVISCGAKVIARHPRSYEREDFVFDPLHYLALIEQKINALDQAAPLAGGDCRRSS